MAKQEISKMDFPDHLKSGMIVSGDGYIFPLITPPRLLPGLKEMEVRPTDIFVITWPKAGTTWMQYFVNHVVKGRKFAEENHLAVSHVFIEMIQDRFNPDTSPGSYEKIRDSPAPRFIKSHLLIALLPTQLFEKKPYIIYVARNPKDAAVSYFHFCASMLCLPLYKSWDEFFHYLCEGLLPFGNYFDHVLPWWEKRNEPNVLFVKYEDMKKNPKGTVLQLCKFFERNLTEEEVKDICFHTSFDEMKNNKNANMDATGFPGVLRENKHSTPFMRKGQVGDWKNYFTVSQNETFDKIYESKMAGTGLTFDFS